MVVCVVACGVVELMTSATGGDDRRCVHGGQRPSSAERAPRCRGGGHVAGDTGSRQEVQDSSSSRQTAADSYRRPQRTCCSRCPSARHCLTSFLTSSSMGTITQCHIAVVTTTIRRRFDGHSTKVIKVTVT